ncbi:M3 family metallopeptidase [uncultured Albimonas sp.]|uniref:M3 family metallopeptidase n=1 Tax=uncultured Albimonas sp. TaxID=1331701 RepID=UPI0030EB955F
MSHETASTAAASVALDAPTREPHGLPPFAAATPQAIREGFERALADHKAEIAAIRDSDAAPDFANTIEALESAGRGLGRVATVFYTLASTCSDDGIRELEREMAPVMSRHWSAVSMDPKLAARVDAVPDAGLSPEQARVLFLWRQGYERSGARLDDAGRARLAEIMEELSTLATRFSQNVLADESAWFMELTAADLDDLPESLVASAARAAKDRGKDGHVVTLARSSVEPFLKLAPRRDLRERAWRAWVSRGANGGETDNRGIIARIVALRIERANLLGFATFADFKLAPEMAKTPDAVRELLMRVWGPARARAEAEAARLGEVAAEEGANPTIEAWDWRYWAEKARARDHALSEAELKPYFPLSGMIEAAFDCAGRLFGLEFREVEGLTLHHPDARAWEVSRDGEPIALFVGDYFARPSKRSGAWMSQMVGQEDFDPALGRVRPVILNVMNFAQGDAETLLSFDDAGTLFHEFGHALHGMLSEVKYPSVSGTSVARDFVELPSQLYEHWLETPEVLTRHARHYRTREPIPAALMEKMLAARNFGQGFSTVEYLASALVDHEMHRLTSADGFEAMEFEASVLKGIGMPGAIVSRHAAPHFLHVFSGDGYSAGYYSYMWSEVMDADAFAAFEEAGDPFDPQTARRLADEILTKGGSRDPMEEWLAFRGREPDPAAMLKGRGLDDGA